MAKIATEYHKNRQRKPEMTGLREESIERMKEIVGKQIMPQQRNEDFTVSHIFWVDSGWNFWNPVFIFLYVRLTKTDRLKKLKKLE